MITPAFNHVWYEVASHPPVKIGQQRDVLFCSPDWGWPILGMVSGWGTLEEWTERTGKPDQYPGHQYSWSLYMQEDDKYMAWEGNDPTMWMRKPTVPKLTVKQIEDTYELIDKLRAETDVHSSDRAVEAHPYYSELIAIGEPLVDMLMTKIIQAGSAVLVPSWTYFRLIIGITGENPVKAENRDLVKKARQDFIDWYEERSLI